LPMLEEVAAKERAVIARLLIQIRYNLAAVERTQREIDRARARLRSQRQPATAGGDGSSRTASSRRSSGANQTATGERGGGGGNAQRRSWATAEPRGVAGAAGGCERARFGFATGAIDDTSSWLGGAIGDARWWRPKSALAGGAAGGQNNPQPRVSSSNSTDKPNQQRSSLRGQCRRSSYISWVLVSYPQGVPRMSSAC
jgi:hypothetical protein